jgi:hypothetical protein
MKPGHVLTPAIERFWAKVNKTETCWLWNGARDANGYGRFYVGSRTIALAHRVSYEMSVGPIPQGLHLDHICRVTSCVNPDHLEAVTPRENLLRGIGPSAINARRTQCKRGHAFTEDNTYRHRNQRYCRACHVLGQTAYVQRLRKSA